MRLLRICDDGSLTLTKEIISDNDIPKYAILSHTWGSEDQEVSFADMVAGKGKDKKGYRKIEFCSNQTRLDGLEYFWVDTCYIDKSNNNELSEAINSMFRWYQHATKCYVYLTDVGEDTTTEQGKRPSGSDLEREFRASRWFTRGWTLQELLAPSLVEFFGSDGQQLGSKRSLEKLINEMTGIPIASLQGGKLSYFTIEERMSWSKGRETTRPEDKAYSLLGIFRVHMPLIYGEGEENAFERLRRETHRYYDWVLERLPIAKGSEFDSHTEDLSRMCQPNTRAEILHQINEWMKDTQGKTIFWLNGMAGTGKSTIARTVAFHAAESGHLGASFFFKRGERDRFGTLKFFSTIVAQITRKEPSFAFHLKSALEEDFSICEGDLQRQFENLILKPFLKAFKHASKDNTVLVVIDALDECESERNIKQIIDIFSRANNTMVLSPRLKIFATSRPDIPIRLGFRAVHGTYKDFILHEVSTSIIWQDIQTYFEYELATIRNEYNNSVSGIHRQLPVYWPSVSDVQTLVQMATPLFIFAATICRFLADRRYGNPDNNLQKVLRYRTRSQESKLDNTYRPVLDMMLMGLSRRERTEAIHDFRAIIGSIIILAEPLSASALATLVDVPRSTVDDRLDMFHSVLDVPSTTASPVRLLHLSFRDFLTDPDKREQYEFWIDEKDAHKKLAARCLQTMATVLRRNISGQKRPDALYSDFNSREMKNNLPPEVIYACEFWAYHLREGDDTCEDQVYSFLRQHFLHWLEALALLGKLSRGIEAIESLYRQLNSGDTQLSQFLSEAEHFIKKSEYYIKLMPLQIYCSALLFAPEGGIIKDAFRHELPKWVDEKLVASTYWTNGHTDVVTVVVFSPDGGLVASGSIDGTVCLWSTDTGALPHTLKGHTSGIHSIAFSGIRNMVASGSHDTVQLWCIDTGVLHQTLPGHYGALSCIAFSPDALLIASGSLDGKIRIWPASYGAPYAYDDAPQRTLEGHKTANLIAFSPDAELLASCSSDVLGKDMLRLWSVAEGLCLSSLPLLPRVKLDHELCFDSTGQFLRTPRGVFRCGRLLGPDLR
ncbi:hypothetical protein F4801DRAFT_105696 [Xylaria longipes]|nr:hypothetical protein F4801DRAFT_105696 [Xylaria longipes]